MIELVRQNYKQNKKIFNNVKKTTTKRIRFKYSYRSCWFYCTKKYVW